MAKVWVKGYTKSDGTKVEGHYREINNKEFNHAAGMIVGKLKAEGLTKKTFTVRRARKILSKTVGSKFNMAAVSSYPRRFRGLLK